MNFHVLTLFPDMIMQGLGTSITGRAIKQGKLNIEAVDIRDFTEDKHRRVDDYTYGGGAGMLMQAQPVYDAWQSVMSGIAKKDVHQVRTIYVTPQGRPFTQKMAEEFASCRDLVILCGHYEGIDERVLEETVTDYVSIGDYVLTGGELAAMVIVDAVSRLVPEVLGNEESAQFESFHGDLLEYPQYSRPEVWHEKQVPKVLLSGNTREIEKWRLEQSKLRTRERRPDLYAAYEKMQAASTHMREADKRLHIDMLECISRGRGELLCWENDEILIQDRGSRVLFHTWLTEGWDCEDPHVQESLAGKYHLDNIFQRYPEILEKNDCICTHQQVVMQELEQMGFAVSCPCYQAVCTRREKLPVTGLYRPDGKPTDQGLTIRQLTPEYWEVVADWYHRAEDEEDYAYVRSRVLDGAIYGAFLGEELAGFIGYHEEGSIGMLEVTPKYQRMHIGMALETYMANDCLEKGWTPYGQVIVGNEVSLAVQRKMGLYLSKGLIYWMHKK